MKASDVRSKTADELKDQLVGLKKEQFNLRFQRATQQLEKPTEVRMGKGKGSVDYWAARVKPGRIVFEIDGVPEDVAKEALRLGAMKLPIMTRVVTRIAD